MYRYYLYPVLRISTFFLYYRSRQSEGHYGYQPSFTKALIRIFGASYLVASMFKLMADVVLLATPYILGYDFIVYIEKELSEATRSIICLF